MSAPVLDPSPVLNPRDIIQQEGLNQVLTDLRRNKQSFTPRDQQQTEELFNALEGHFQNLRDVVGYLTENRGENLRKMDPENLKLILEVIADSPEEAARLKLLLEQNKFEELAKAIQVATTNPEKLIEISEIMLMDASISRELKAILYQNLLAINKLLEGFHDLSERYTLVIPTEAFGRDTNRRREAYAAEIGTLFQRRILEVAGEQIVRSVVDGVVDLMTMDRAERLEKLAEIRQQIGKNREAQATLRQDLFVLRTDQKSEYREIMRKIVSLAGDENYLLEQERIYRRDPLQPF